MAEARKISSLDRRRERLRNRYGPWAAVTGASSGIGREMALRLAEAGLNLVLVARSQGTLDQTAANFTAHRGIEVRVIGTDLARKTAVEAVEAATRDLDVGLLVAAAGFGTSGTFVDASLEKELEMLEVNCRALEPTFWTTVCQAWTRRDDLDEFARGVPGHIERRPLRGDQGLRADVG